MDQLMEMFHALGVKMGTTMCSTTLNEAKAKWASLKGDDQERAKQQFYLGAAEGRKAKEQAK